MRIQLALIFFVLVVALGCATDSLSPTEEVLFQSEPPGATVSITPGGVTWTTPARVSLDREQNYVATFELHPYPVQVVEVTAVKTSSNAALMPPFMWPFIMHKTRAAPRFRLGPNPVRVVFEDRLSAALPDKVARVTFSNTNYAYSNGRNSEIFIRIDGDVVGTVRGGETLDVVVSPGKHTLYLAHIDLVLFEDEYEIEFEQGETILEISNGAISTGYDVVRSPRQSD